MQILGEVTMVLDCFMQLSMYSIAEDYVRETKEIFEFICALISQAKRKGTIEPFYQNFISRNFLHEFYHELKYLLEN